MGSYRIAVIAGDGIGPEVVAEAVRALKALTPLDPSRKLAVSQLPRGSPHYLKEGRLAPPDFLERLSRFDAILLGAVGHPKVPDHLTLGDFFLPIRREFDLYVNLRPIRLYPGARSPLRDVSPQDIDMLVFRENTEGEYAPAGGRLYRGTPEEVAVHTAIFTRRGCGRIMRAAFEAAMGRRRHVSSITKSNAQGYTLVLWDEVFDQVSREYPKVKTAKYLVDAACMFFVRDPRRFDVVVASNLFGDIITDLGAAIAGSMGLAPSANLNPERKYPSMFEPIHGSAPDIADRGIANPVAQLFSAAMMLDFLGERKASERLEASILENLAQGEVKTPDLGGRATTRQVGDDIIKRLNKG